MNRIEDVSDWYHGRAGYQGYPITPDDRLNWKSPQTILKHCPPDLIGGERKLSKPPTPKPPKPKAVRPLEQAEMDRLRKLVAAILRRLAKYEPDALGLLDEIYPKQDDLNDAIPGFGDEDAAS